MFGLIVMFHTVGIFETMPFVMVDAAVLVQVNRTFLQRCAKPLGDLDNLPSSSPYFR